MSSSEVQESAPKPSEATGRRSSQDVRINYDEVGNLVGRLLTMADATFIDLQQRKAQKDLIRTTVFGWLESQYEQQYDGWTKSESVPSERTIREFY